jgi:hypothetical protein
MNKNGSEISVIKVSLISRLFSGLSGLLLRDWNRVTHQMFSTRIFCKTFLEAFALSENLASSYK